MRRYISIEAWNSERPAEDLLVGQRQHAVLVFEGHVVVEIVARMDGDQCDHPLNVVETADDVAADGEVGTLGSMLHDDALVSWVMNSSEFIIAYSAIIEISQNTFRP